MKRILLVLTVALVMAAMMVVMVAPAFARYNRSTPDTSTKNPNDYILSTGNSRNHTCNPPGASNNTSQC